jgi:S-adenosyl-L-methionine hydrolase (adenosine-forming)
VPIVTLTTDLGKDTHLLAKLKMQLLKAIPGVQIIDIAHNVLPHAIDEAVYLANSCAQDFDAGTLHIVGVDADLYKYNRLLCAVCNGQLYLTADNGFASMLEAQGDLVVYDIPIGEGDRLTAAYLKKSFVPAAINILEKGVETVGTVTNTFLEKNLELPFMEDDSLRGKVVYVNNYQNAVTNITRKVFDDEGMGRYFEIAINRFDRITEISDTYSQAPEGEGLCFFNENGLLEIAVNRGKAAQLLGLERGKMITIEFSAEPPKAKSKPGGLFLF